MHTILFRPLFGVLNGENFGSGRYASSILRDLLSELYDAVSHVMFLDSEGYATARHIG